ncbi:MAG: serine protease AprX [Acidimicrobiaceae bacterium]|nr:serine protease AprX [Acidimicrobiaceae bacterium]
MGFMADGTLADGNRPILGRAWRTKATVVAVVACTALFTFGTSAHAASNDKTGDGASAVTDSVMNGDSNANADGSVHGPGWDRRVTAPATSLALVTKVIRADQLWSRGIDGSGIGVALIDSGVAPVPGLDGEGKLINGADLSFDSQSDAMQYVDAYGHGTHMASIIAGDDGTNSDFSGVAPGAHIVSVKVGAIDGAVDVSQVIAGIDWAVQHRNDPGLNIRVISLSYGTDSVQNYQIDPLTTAVESAWRNGIVVVVSGGNGGVTKPSLTDPATDPYVLAVGAADLGGTTGKSDDRVADFSSRGSATRGVDVVAPGVSVLGLRDPGSIIDDLHPDAVVDGRYFRGSGTSQATAITAGAVALLLDARPELTPDMVKAILRETATPLAGATTRDEGGGLINVRAANAAVVRPNYRQTWPAANGSGSLETARGGEHVADDGVELTGEVDIMGQAWNGARWAKLSAIGAAWSGGSWNGAVWTGSTWNGTNWESTTWSGRSWSGRSWSGRSWSGRSWSGRSWSGRSWSGRSWSGRSWSVAAWDAD